LIFVDSQKKKEEKRNREKTHGAICDRGRPGEIETF